MTLLMESRINIVLSMESLKVRCGILDEKTLLSSG